MYDDDALIGFIEAEGPKLLGCHSVKALGCTSLAKGWETYIHCLSIEFDDGNRDELVLRIFPYAGEASESKAEKEYKTLKALYGIVPVPKVYGIYRTDESLIGLPVMVMEKVRGRTISELFWKSNDTEYRRRLIGRFVEALVQLHHTELDNLECISPDFDISNPYGYIDSFLDDARHALEHDPLGEEFRPLVAWFEENRNTAPCHQYSLLHGDYHMNNVMMDDNNRINIIDWPASKVGDYRDDLAWAYATAIEIPGFNEMMLDMYKKYSNEALDGFDFYLVKGAVNRVIGIILPLNRGLEASGMASDVREQMLRCKGQVRKAYEIVKDITGIRLPMIDEFLTGM